MLISSVFLMTSILTLKFGGAKGEDVELGGLPFNKRANHQVPQLIPAYLGPVLRIEERRHQLVVVQVNLIDEILHHRVPGLRVVEVRAHELVEVRLDAVLVFK